MPTGRVLIRQSNGQTIALYSDDRIVKEVTIECSSQRCASRHGQESPVTFVFNDQDPFPEAGDQFLSLILPERSPSNPQYPLPFCGPQCLKDFLTYQYFAPGPRQPASTENVQTAEVEAAITAAQPVHESCGLDLVEADEGIETPEPTVIAQADGAGE